VRRGVAWQRSRVRTDTRPRGTTGDVGAVATVLSTAGGVEFGEALLGDDADENGLVSVDVPIDLSVDGINASV
jgi:hypothetical protein